MVSSAFLYPEMKYESAYKVTLYSPLPKYTIHKCLTLNLEIAAPLI